MVTLTVAAAEGLGLGKSEASNVELVGSVMLTVWLRSKEAPFSVSSWGLGRSNEVAVWATTLTLPINDRSSNGSKVFSFISISIYGFLAANIQGIM